MHLIPDPGDRIFFVENERSFEGMVKALHPSRNEIDVEIRGRIVPFVFDSIEILAYLPREVPLEGGQHASL